MTRLRLFAYLALFLAIAPAFGCVGLSAQILHVLVGQKVKAEYDGLKKQRVAVLVASDFDGGPDYEMDILSQLVGQRLKSNVKDIDLVSPRDVRNAYDPGDIDQNYTDIGKILKADKIVVVEVSSFSLRMGSTLYQGNATYSTRVYDVETDELRFHQGPLELRFPTAGQPVTDTSESQFSKTFLTELSYKVAKVFYDHAVEEEFGRDALAY